MKKKPVEEDRRDLRSRVLRCLRGGALTPEEITHRLALAPRERGRMPGLFQEMEAAGEVVRVRKNRYVLPKEADLFVGRIQFHASGTAHVRAEAPEKKDLYISGENTFVAMHGDKVVARVMPPGQTPGARPEGRVIRVLERATETVVGTLQRTRNFFHVAADDPRFVHHVSVPAPAPPIEARPGDKVVVRIESWPSRHVNPEGVITEVLGPSDAPGVDMLAIIRKHGFSEDFPGAALREAERVSAISPGAESAGREDFRNRFVITIDPDDAKDFDDAIEVEETASGWKLWVHIADVAHYVRPESALDREAYSRGNSIYLADRVIPMLPESLSNGLCSLLPEEDRLVFSVCATIAKSGKVTSARFCRGIIRSARRLTYREAFALLKAPVQVGRRSDPLSARLRTAWKLAELLRKQRFAAGALELDFPEVKVRLDARGVPVSIEKVENDISHQLIEEFMLLANDLVARELKLARQPALYRVHEKPETERLEEFRETAASFGIRIGNLTQRPELKKLLTAIRGKPWEHTLKVALLKSLKRARYAAEPLGHYGLHKSDYTHFTSPIRRYSDLVVHRALARRLGQPGQVADSARLKPLAEHLSSTERAAAEAESESTRIKKLEFFDHLLQKNPRQKFRARILEVRNYALLVELPDFLVSGLVRVSAMEGDFYIYNAARSALVGRRTRKVFRMGGEVLVRVDRVDTLRQQINFRPA